jgi:hypothetical protein
LPVLELQGLSAGISPVRRVRESPALGFGLIRRHHIPRHDPAYPAESREGAAGLFRRHHIDAGAEAGVERCLIERTLPTDRPFLKKVQRLVDAVDFLDRIPEGAGYANRNSEMQFVHDTTFERSPLEQRRSSLLVIWA